MRQIALVLLLSTCATCTALAQSSQFPGVAPSVPSPFTPPPQLGGAPAPPAVVTGPMLPQPLSGPTIVTRPHRTPVLVPGGPSNFSNRVERCIEAGTAAGVGPGHIGAFTGRCVQ
jgi:hypothetical protein